MTVGAKVELWMEASVTEKLALDAFWEIKKRVVAGYRYTAAFEHVSKKFSLEATELRRAIESWEHALGEKIPHAHRSKRTKKKT
jgi:hypothetical protein